MTTATVVRRQRRTVSWADLERFSRVPIHYDRHVAPTRFDYARYFGVSVSTIDRWREHGVPWRLADEIAVKVLGVHPATVWADWFDDALTPT